MTRRLAQLALACLLVALTAQVAYAQRGGGSPGGGGGNHGGGMNPGDSGMSPAGTFPSSSHMGNGNFPTSLHEGHSLPTPGMHQFGLPGRWWDDSRTAHSIGLRADQQKRMDAIFEANRPQIEARFSDLQKEQQRLNTMPSRDLADENKVYSEVDRITQARADLEKATSQTFAQIRQQLDETQQARLDDQIARQKR